MDVNQMVCKKLICKKVICKKVKGKDFQIDIYRIIRYSNFNEEKMKKYCYQIVGNSYDPFDRFGTQNEWNNFYQESVNI